MYSFLPGQRGGWNREMKTRTGERKISICSAKYSRPQLPSHAPHAGLRRTQQRAALLTGRAFPGLLCHSRLLTGGRETHGRAHRKAAQTTDGATPMILEGGRFFIKGTPPSVIILMQGDASGKHVSWHTSAVSVREPTPGPYARRTPPPVSFWEPPLILTH